MGGEVAITGAALDPRLKAVVAEGATARICDDLTFLPNDRKARSTTSTAASAGRLWPADDAPQPATAPTTEPARDPPVLLIAADLDEEHAATDAFQAVSPSTIQLWQPAGASHTGALSAYPLEWERRVVDFFAASSLPLRRPHRNLDPWVAPSDEQS